MLTAVCCSAVHTGTMSLMNSESYMNSQIGCIGIMTPGLRIRHEDPLGADSNNSLSRPKLTASTTEREVRACWGGIKGQRVNKKLH